MASQLKTEFNPSELSQDSTPSPSSPQTIHKVTGNNTINIINKNFIPTTLEEIKANNTSGTWNNNVYTDAGLTITVRNDLSVVINGTSTAQGTFLICNNKSLSAGTYVLNGTNEEARLYIWDSSWTNIISTLNSTEFTISEDKIIKVGINISNNKTFTNFVVKPMISLNGGAYEPHKEQVYSINLGDLEYCKIGNYSDKFFKNTIDSEDYNSTLQLNKWYLKKNIGKVIFTGASSENWYYTSQQHSVFTTTDNTSPYTSNAFTPYCNYYQGTTKSTGASSFSQKGNNLVSFLQDVSINRVLISDDRFTSSSDFADWLSTHNITIYFPTSTPTYILLNDTLQEELDNIDKYAKSYNGQTNINQVNADLSFNINASAVYDLNKLIDRVATLETE